MWKWLSTIKIVAYCCKVNQSSDRFAGSSLREPKMFTRLVYFTACAGFKLFVLELLSLMHPVKDQKCDFFSGNNLIMTAFLVPISWPLHHQGWKVMMIISTSRKQTKLPRFQGQVLCLRRQERAGNGGGTMKWATKRFWIIFSMCSIMTNEKSLHLQVLNIGPQPRVITSDTAFFRGSMPFERKIFERIQLSARHFFGRKSLQSSVYYSSRMLDS